ncbi:hypothetical protein [Aureimonas sp. AU20]|uniref:hypothetical protein n=1 Tax=Aureimonas sp. AU20 TaxID=1349819 RepID=UPI000A76141C|nr:hypothetical protein [Aureimonas sp. AU20]
MSGWIKHDGKALPVAPQTAVDIRFEDGCMLNDFAGEWHAQDPRNSHWVWEPEAMFGHEIVAYRVLEPSA